MFISWNIIWGLLIILFGISILIKAIFGLDIPLVKMLIGLVLIYVGFTILTDFSSASLKKRMKRTFNFSTDAVYITNPHQYEKYSVVFGQSVFDFSRLDPTIEPAVVKINTIFGHSIIILDPKIPVKLTINSSFSNIEMPDKTTASFGDFVYKTQAAYQEKPILEIKATVVFGNLRIQEAN